jgi:hypothetical protein
MADWEISFKAIDPRFALGRWNTGVSGRLLRLLRQQGHDARLARLVLVREVLCESPLEIRRGWSRYAMEDCFVYVGMPNRDFRRLTIETPPPPGSVFLVFVLEDGTIDEWNWRALIDGYPEGVDGAVLWTPNQS